MYLARCNQQLGETTAAENNWQRALEAANSAPEKLMQLADYAEKNGARKIATSAVDAALQTAPKSRAAWQAKLRLAQAGRETGRIHSTLAAMLKVWPNDPAIQNDEGYTRLLLATAKDEGQGTKDEVEATGGTTAVSSKSGRLSLPTSDLRTLTSVPSNSSPSDSFKPSPPASPTAPCSRWFT